MSARDGEKLRTYARQVLARPSPAILKRMARKVATPPQPDPIDSDEILTEAPAIEESDAPTVFNASEEDAGVRLDHFLVARIPDVSRVRVQHLVEQGKVLVNERPSKASLKLKGSEVIEIIGNVEAAPLKAFAEDIPLTVVFEDKELAVVNKPAGMVVHASTGSAEDPRNRGTLVNALLFRFNKLSEMGGELRPGIVHRLDKDTSGLIVVAKNDVAHRKLVEQFSSRQVHKTYLALVHNWPKTDEGTINDPVGRDPRNRTRMSVTGIDPRTAVSHYKVIERLLTPYGRFALMEVRIETGRTHQIRVHLSHLGHPIWGDTLYGRRAPVEGFYPARQMLHAARIEIAHPLTGKPLRLEASLPGDYAANRALLLAEKL